MRSLIGLVAAAYLVYLVTALEVSTFQVIDLVGLAQGRNDWLAVGGEPPIYLLQWR